MDFSQVLIPVVVLTPLIALVVFAIKRGAARKPAMPIVEPPPSARLPRSEPTASRSTTVAREITLSSKYEKHLVRLLKEGGWTSALCQLPPLPPFFVGRRSELARAFALLEVPEPPRTLAITSLREIAGVGRTGFITVLGHLLALRFPDAQLYIDLQKTGRATGSNDVVEAMCHVVRTLNPETPLPKDLAELPALYRESLENRRVLLLVENIRPQPYLETLRPPAGSLLLLSSREPIAFARIDTIALDPLSRPDGRAFLRASNARLNRETDTRLDLLAELSGYLPEALRLNANRLFADPSQTMDWHCAQLKRADAFNNPLEAALALSGIPASPIPREPSPMETTTAPEPTDLKSSAPADQVPPAESAKVEKDEKQWESARDFVQRFQSLSESDFSLADLPPPFADPSCGPAPEYADALRLLASFPEVTPTVTHLEAAVSAARALQDRDAEISALAALGKARAESGEPRLAVACFECCVEAAGKAGDHLAEIDALGCLGGAWLAAGFADRGTGCFEAQLQIARSKGVRESELIALGKLGQATALLGDFKTTADLYGRQLAVARELGNRSAELDALENLGLAHSRLKEVDKAAHFHEEQLLAACSAGDQSSERRALGYLGQAAIQRGKIDEAIARYEAQLELARMADDLASQNHAHASLGVAWARQGDLRKAVAHYEQQLQIAQHLGNRAGEASAYSNIGAGLERLGDLAGAASSWEQALAIYQSLGSPSADTMHRWLERVRKGLAAGVSS